MGTPATPPFNHFELRFYDTSRVCHHDTFCTPTSDHRFAQNTFSSASYGLLDVRRHAVVWGDIHRRLFVQQPESNPPRHGQPAWFAGFCIFDLGYLLHLVLAPGANLGHENLGHQARIGARPPCDAAKGLAALRFELALVFTAIGADHAFWTVTRNSGIFNLRLGDGLGLAQSVSSPKTVLARCLGGHPLGDFSLNTLTKPMNLPDQPKPKTPHAFSICVYCGSKSGLLPEFAQLAAQVGTWIGAHGGQLVYGGGRNGLMGVVAEATLAAGGTVVGIIPQALVEKEWAHHGCTQLIVVDTMHERKRLMAEKADAFLALPGGIGTFEELFEVWTWRQLGYHDKPVGILNSHGYYDGLMAFIDEVVQKGFMTDWQTKLVNVGTDAVPLLKALVQTAGFSPTTKLELI